MVIRTFMPLGMQMKEAGFRRAYKYTLPPYAYIVPAGRHNIHI